MSSCQENIVLIGFMGTGKSTVGKHIAQKTGRVFVDADYEIERLEHMPISDIFSVKGEKYFRDKETAVIKELVQHQNTVIATGGGAVLRSENIRHLRQTGVIIHLKADVETILRNTAKDTKRPLLQANDVKARIVSMLAQRQPYYEQHDYEVDVSHLTVEQIVDAIIQHTKGGRIKDAII